MTGRSPLSELMADAVADPPATTVTASQTYRRGRRRYKIARAGTVGGLAALVAAVAIGGAQLRPKPDVTPPPATPRWTLDPLPETPMRCADLAEAVETVAAAALPADIRWTGTQLGPGATDCAGGGLFWVHFVFRGAGHTLGFEGGQGVPGTPCDARRGVTYCEEDGGCEVGHYESPDDYGVLLGRPGLFFFLGLDNGSDPPLTTDQLAVVAKQIARVVYLE